MKIESDEIRNAVAVTMAAKILEGITDEHRDAILQGSIESALKDWEFRDAVQKEVADKARQVAAEMLRSKEWSDRIAFAVEEGLQRYTRQLPAAVEKALIEMMHGSIGERNYDCKPGSILKHMPRVIDDK